METVIRTRRTQWWMDTIVERRNASNIDVVAAGAQGVGTLNSLRKP